MIIHLSIENETRVPAGLMFREALGLSLAKEAAM
jgi:hypothetical protein